MRILAMIRRVLLEMVRDKRTLALMFLAPLLILTLMYFLFQSSTTEKANLAVKNVDSSLIQALNQTHVKIHRVTSNDSTKKIIRNHNYDGLLEQKNHKLTLTLANVTQTKTGMIRQSLQAAQVKLRLQTAGQTISRQQVILKQLQLMLGTRTPRDKTAQQRMVPASYQLSTHYLYGSSDSTYFNTLLPIMIGFVVFFFVFLISGVAMLKERTSGTLYRLLATPIRKIEILMGYLIGYGLFALIQTLLVVVYSIFVFKIQILGSIWAVLLVNMLTAIVALALGLLVSTFATSEFQMVQFIPIVVIPQIFFSGLIPIDQMARWLQPVAKVMPIYYSAQAVRDIIQKGANLVNIMPEVIILLVFTGIFLALNLLVFRRYRQV
ncbi:ABC transporter permease [Lactobacillus sp. CC-MHH1034]|uniref:ABC transporter permease n=1 Tax=Agrilactobacillus fermenti TaxID=2586909 RepID=UPI001E50FB30|nr:ABC transporter permease [Agrilactobacillus fermenti]MCD2256805.1 ABC transporter permease [Agrilactobacillus fermenti]